MNMVIQTLELRGDLIEALRGCEKKFLAEAQPQFKEFLTIQTWQTECVQIYGRVFCGFSYFAKGEVSVEARTSIDRLSAEITGDLVGRMAAIGSFSMTIFTGNYSSSALVLEKGIGGVRLNILCNEKSDKLARAFYLKIITSGLLAGYEIDSAGELVAPQGTSDERQDTVRRSKLPAMLQIQVRFSKETAKLLIDCSRTNGWSRILFLLRCAPSHQNDVSISELGLPSDDWVYRFIAKENFTEESLCLIDNSIIAVPLLVSVTPDFSGYKHYVAFRQPANDQLLIEETCGGSHYDE